MATVLETKLMTAEEFLRQPDDGRRSELVKGEVVEMNLPGFRHGEVCNKLGRVIGNFAEHQALGRTINNDAGIITGRNPDTVRGADVAYYSYHRVPQGQSPVGYPGAAPEIAFEVVSPSNSRKQIAIQIGEYLTAGVNVVCVVDPEFKTVNLHCPDRPTAMLDGDVLLTFAELPGFSTPVSVIFQ